MTKYLPPDEYWAKREKDRNDELEVLGELQADRDREERYTSRQPF